MSDLTTRFNGNMTLYRIATSYTQRMCGGPYEICSNAYEHATGKSK